MSSFILVTDETIFRNEERNVKNVKEREHPKSVSASQLLTLIASYKSRSANQVGIILPDTCLSMTLGLLSLVEDDFLLSSKPTTYRLFKFQPFVSAVCSSRPSLPNYRVLARAIKEA